MQPDPAAPRGGGRGGWGSGGVPLPARRHSVAESSVWASESRTDHGVGALRSREGLPPAVSDLVEAAHFSYSSRCVQGGRGGRA
jgi:hypothetical protein